MHGLQAFSDTKLDIKPIGTNLSLKGPVINFWTLRVLFVDRSEAEGA